MYLSQREKSIRIQALIPVAPIEALNVAIFNGFSGTDEIEFRVIQIRPCLKFPRCKFRSVINRDYLLASFPGLTAAEATAPLSCNQPDEALAKSGGAWSDLIEDEFPGCRSGCVMALHSAGELLNFHPHAHSLMLHGAPNKAGQWHSLQSVQLEYLTSCFQRRVLEVLLEEKLLDQETVDNMLSWENSGFHVFVGEPIEPTDE